VDIVIPVLDEARVVGRSVRRVHEFCRRRLPYNWRIVVAENGSRDRTAEVAREVAAALDRVDVLALDQPGRGRALRAAWSTSRADIVAYTDVDLSTALDGFLPLLRALVEDRYDLAVGSRLRRESRTARSRHRQLISRAYNALLRAALGVGFSDAQTGFKALTREVVIEVVPLVEDDSWFFDTELLVLAERLGYRIADIPVVWVEGDDSHVRLVRTAWDDLKAVARLRRQLGDARASDRIGVRRKARA
jgi:glycosyltransferase involved in cell wall biosynthesis